MSPKQLRLPLSILVILGSLWSLTRSCTPPVSAAANHKAVGYQLARALGGASGPAGGTFKVIGRQQAHDVLDKEIESFLDGMADLKKWTFGGREDIPPAPGDGEQALGVPADQFADALSRCKGADLVVSFVGLPAPGGTDVRTVLATVPAVVVVNGAEDRVRPLVEEGAIRMAVVFKRSSDVSPANEALDPKSWFDLFYEVIQAPAKP